MAKTHINKTYEEHYLYCMHCGKMILNIFRKKGAPSNQGFHRKVMYCPHCKVTCNAVECRNQQEVFQFKNNFENGLYKQEAIESIEFLKENNIDVKYAAGVIQNK